jgi:hypothetical protein
MIHITRTRKGYRCNGEARAIVDCENGNHTGCIRVLYDPDEDGGFPPGALLTRLEVMNMLNLNCFTVGTRVFVPGYGEMEVEIYWHLYDNGIRRERQALRGRGFRLISPPDPCGRSLIKRTIIA